MRQYFCHGNSWQRGFQSSCWVMKYHCLVSKKTCNEACPQSDEWGVTMAQSLLWVIGKVQLGGGGYSLQWRHMSAMVSQITRRVVLDYSDWQKRKYQSPALLTRRVNMCACVCVVAVRIHRWPVDSTHKEPIKCFHVMTSSSPLCKRYFRILWITSIFDMCHNGCGACQIWTQWCAVITRFGIAWYCIHHCSGWSRI